MAKFTKTKAAPEAKSGATSCQEASQAAYLAL